MVAATLYGLAMQSLANKEIDWDSDNLKLTLHTSAYVPNRDTNRYFSAIGNELATGGGYTAGGALLASKTVAYDSSTHKVTLDAADVTWSAATFTGARYAVLRSDTGTASTSPVILWVDFGADQAPGGTDFTVVWAATGIITLTET